MQLQGNSTLHGGKYKIISVLGQGGFGITYLATMQTEIKGSIGVIKTAIKVAVKEFFMKEHCNRDTATSQVSISSQGAKELVESFKRKFIKEAQTLAALEHPNIVKIYDVFEENGTAYYAMEHIEGGSLSDCIAQHGPMPEQTALRYIRQIAGALEYLHNRQMNHLDVKPGNILLNASDDAILIDFGLSKHYDDDGHATSTTPVGISHGYAPMEQYRNGGVSEFSPATDIYSLGATLYKLLTGKTPPDASYVFDDGLPSLPAEISAATRNAVVQAMQPKRKDRPQTIGAFLSLLDMKQPAVEDTEITVVTLPPSFTDNEPERPKKEKQEPANMPTDQKSEAGTTFETHWDNRPMFTNIMLLLACISSLFGGLTNLIDYSEENIILCCIFICIASSIAMLLYNKWQGILPFITAFACFNLIIAGFYIDDSEKIAVCVFDFMAAIVFGSLFIRKNGISVWKYMINQSKSSSRKEIAEWIFVVIIVAMTVVATFYWYEEIYIYA